MFYATHKLLWIAPFSVFQLFVRHVRLHSVLLHNLPSSLLTNKKFPMLLTSQAIHCIFGPEWLILDLHREQFTYCEINSICHACLIPIIQRQHFPCIVLSFIDSKRLNKITWSSLDDRKSMIAV